MPGEDVGFVQKPGQREDIEALVLHLRDGLALPEGAANGDIFEYAQAFEGERHLKAAAHAGKTALLGRHRRDITAVEPDAARVGPEPAGDQVEECGLARAIGADDPQRVATAHLQVDGVSHDQRTERLGHGLEFKEHVGGFHSDKGQGQALTTCPCFRLRGCRSRHCLA